MKYLFMPIIAVVFLAAMQCPSHARSVAVFPLLDLSRDYNGMNFTLTDYLRGKIAEQDFEILPPDMVMDFMVRHRIRKLGVLTSQQISRVHSELEAEYVLLGTVCQLSAMPGARISLSLQLIRTIDEEIVWSTIRDLHRDDMISLLALSDPETMNDLYERYFNSLFQGMPAEFAQGEETRPDLGFLTVSLRPQTPKPGEKMELAARIYTMGTARRQPDFTLLVGGADYPVRVDEEAAFIEASWQAQETAGTYAVELVTDFGDGHEQVSTLAEYRVDGTPPAVDVSFIGTRIGGEIYFNRDLYILPRMEVPERTSSWEVAVFDDEGTLILVHEGEGQLPPRIIWNGFISGKEKAPDGRYRVMVRAWDMAGNLGEAEKPVNLRSDSPFISFTVEKMAESITLEMKNETQYPLDFWFLKVYRKSGALVAMEVGEELPPSLKIELPELAADEKLEMIFAGQDLYGNRTYQTVDDLFNLASAEVEQEFIPESKWLESF